MYKENVYLKYQYDQICFEQEEEAKREQQKVAQNYLSFKKALSNTDQDTYTDFTSYQSIDNNRYQEKGDFSMIVDSINQYVNSEDQNNDSSYQDLNESISFLGKFDNSKDIFTKITTKQQKKEEIKKNQQILNYDLNLIKKENDVLILNYCLLFEYDPQKERTLNKNQIVFMDKSDYCEQMMDKLILEQMKKIKMDLRRYLQGYQLNESYRNQKYDSIKQLNFKIICMKFTYSGFSVHIITKQQQDIYSQGAQLNKENLILFINQKKKLLFTGTVLFSSEYIDKNNKNPEAFQQLDETLNEENVVNIAQKTNNSPSQNNIDSNKDQATKEFFSSIRLNINQTNAIEVIKELLDPKDLVIFEVQNRWMPFKCNFLALKYMLDDAKDVSFCNEIIKGQSEQLSFDQFKTHNSKYSQNNPNYSFFQNLDKKLYFNKVLKFIDEFKNQKKLTLSQIDCMKYILTQKIALVQNIQGIQKSQIQFEAVKILLQTYSKQLNKKPILIICHSNDTLNKYLEELSQYENNVKGNEQNQKNQQISVLRLGNVGKMNYSKYSKYLLPNELRNPINPSQVTEQMNQQWSQYFKYNKMANRQLNLKDLRSFQLDFNEKAKIELFQQINFPEKITNLLISQYFADLSEDEKKKIQKQQDKIFSLWINQNLSSQKLEHLLQIELSQGLKKIIDYNLDLIIKQKGQYNNLYQSTYYRISEINPIIFNLQGQQLDNSHKSFSEFVNGFEKLSQITFYHIMSIHDYMIYFFKKHFIYDIFKQMNLILNKKREENNQKQTALQYEYFLQQDVILTTVNYSHTYSLVFKILQPEIVIIDEACSIQNEHQIANVLLFQPKHMIQFGDSFQLNLREKEEVLKVKNQKMNAQFLRLIRTKIPVYKTILRVQVRLDLYLLVNLVLNKDLVDEQGEMQQSIQLLQEELNNSELQKNKKYYVYVNSFDIQQPYIVIINIKKNSYKNLFQILKQNKFIFYHKLKEDKINITIQNIYLYQQRESDYVFIICNKQYEKKNKYEQGYFQYSFQNVNIVNVTGADFRFFNQLDILAQITYKFHQTVMNNKIKQVRFQLNPFYYLLDYDKINEDDLKITCYDKEILVENFLKKHQKLIQENAENQMKDQVLEQLQVSQNQGKSLSNSSQLQKQNQPSQINLDKVQDNKLIVQNSDEFIGVDIKRNKQKVIYVKKSKNIFDDLNQPQMLEEKYENQQIFNKALKNINLLISKSQKNITKVLLKIEKYLRKLINFMDDEEKADFYEERMDQVILKLVNNYSDIELFYESLKNTADVQDNKFQYKFFIILQQDILIKQLNLKIKQNNYVKQKQSYISDLDQSYQIIKLIYQMKKRIFKNNQKLIQKLDLIEKHSSQILDLEWILLQILIKEAKSSQNKEVQLIGQINNKIKNFKFKVAYQKSNISFSEFQFQFYQENDKEVQLQQVQELNQILIDTLQQQYKSYIMILAKTQSSWTLKKINIEKDLTQKFEEECSNIFIFVKQKLKNAQSNQMQQTNQPNDIEVNLSSKLLNSINKICQIYNS
ncbi:hypothetical protein ABPG74_007742 [Tetrahymena malaccensis]